MGNPGVPGIVDGPATLDFSYEQLQALKFEPLRHLPSRPGYVTVYPVVVKLRNNEGEFLVYGDKSIQWTDYASGHVSAPFYIK